MPAFELATARVTPFQSTPQHQALAAFVGEWEGPTQTWFGPAVPADLSSTRARIELLLGGRFLRIVTEGNTTGSPHAGELIVGFDPAENVYTGVWFDSFHMSPAFMVSIGAPRGDGVVSLLGSYRAGPESWGWRTVLRVAGPDQLVLEATNVTPQGEEHRAIETRLTRAGKPKQAARGKGRAKPKAVVKPKPRAAKRAARAAVKGSSPKKAAAKRGPFGKRR